MKSHFQTISPIDGSIYVEKPYSTEKEVGSTFENAKKSQSLWRQVKIEDRAEICLKAVELMLEQKQEIAEEITWQMGRPIQYSAGEIAGFAERAEFMVATAFDKLQPIMCSPQAGFNRYIQRDPIGCLFSIAPWNYPYLTAVNSIIPALMAGNSVVLKPSNQTPLTALRIFSALKESGLPDNVFQVLFLSHQNVQSVLESADINAVAFTGSVSGGLAVQDALRKRFIQSGLELGGKDAAYVRADANIEFSVDNLVDGAFFNSGQSCCGIERIYVHKKVYDEFVDRFVATVNNYKLGDPRLMDTTLGPMVRTKSADFVRSQISDAVKAGASALIDESAFSDSQQDTPYLAPQVLVNVGHSMSVMKDESFGPVVGIMKVNTDDHAIRHMNDSEFGLTGSVWTQDEEAAVQIGEQVNVGTWFMNRCDYLDPALAWTGLKNSGRGVTLSEIGFEQLTQAKSFHLRYKI